MSASKSTNSQMVAKLQRLASATGEYLGNKTQTLLGKPWKGTDLGTFFQQQATALQDTDAMYQQWRNAVAHNRATFASQVTPLVAALKSYLGSTLGTASQVYIAMGFTAPKKPGPSP
jgi:hypothetical protein